LFSYRSELERRSEAAKKKIENFIHSGKNYHYLISYDVECCEVFVIFLYAFVSF